MHFFVDFNQIPLHVKECHNLVINPGFLSVEGWISMLYHADVVGESQYLPRTNGHIWVFWMIVCVATSLSLYHDIKSTEYGKDGHVRGEVYGGNNMAQTSCATSPFPKGPIQTLQKNEKHHQTLSIYMIQLSFTAFSMTFLANAG
jgi:hypothetical protein